MTIYKVKDPQGNSYTVEGPEGASDEEVLSQVQAYTNQQPTEAKEPEKNSSDFMRGLGNYIPGMKEIGRGAEVGAGLLAKNIGAEQTGKELIQSGIQGMNIAKSQQINKDTDSFTNAWDKGISSVLTDYLPYQMGAGVGSIGESLAAAGVGAAIGSAIGPEGTVPGALAGLLEKSLVKTGVRAMAEKIAKEQGEDVAEQYVKKEAGKIVGGIAGTAAQAGVHGVGEVTGRAVDELKKPGMTPEETQAAVENIDINRLAPAMLTHGVADFVAEKIGLNAIGGLSKAATGNIYKDILKTVAATGAKEILPEEIQSIAERYGAKLSLSDADAFKEYIDTAASSVAMSVAPGAIGGAKASQQAQTAVAKQEVDQKAEEDRLAAEQQAKEIENKKIEEAITASGGQTSLPNLFDYTGKAPVTEEDVKDISEKTAAEYLHGLDARFTNPSQIKTALKDTEFEKLGAKKVLDVYKSLPTQEDLFDAEGDLNQNITNAADIKRARQDKIASEYQAKMEKAKEGENLDIFGAPKQPSYTPEEIVAEEKTPEKPANLMMQDILNKADQENQIAKEANKRQPIVNVTPEGNALTPEQYQARVEADPFKQHALDIQEAQLKAQHGAQQQQNAQEMQDKLAKVQSGENLDIFGEPSAPKAAQETIVPVEQPSQGGSANLQIQEAIKQAEKDFDIEKANRLREQLNVTPEGVALKPDEYQVHADSEFFKQRASELQQEAKDKQAIEKQAKQKVINDALIAHDAKATKDTITTINTLAKELGLKGDLKSKVDQLRNVDVTKDQTENKYSVADTATDTGHTADSLSKTLSPEMKALVSSGKAVIHDTAATLPGENHPANVQGMTTKEGITHYVANKLTPKTLDDLAVHEVGVHVGMEKMVGPKVWKDITNQVMSNKSAVYEKARASVPKDTPENLKAEETLAYLVEHAPNLPLVRRLISSIRNWVRTRFGANIKLTEDDARHLAVSVLRKESKTAQTSARKESDVRYSVAPKNDADLRAATQVYATPEAKKEPSTFDKATGAGKYISDTPLNSILDDFKAGVDKFRTAVAHSGSPIERWYQQKYNGVMRDALTNEIRGDILYDQAIASKNQAVATLEQGKPIIEDGVVRIQKDDNNVDNMFKLLNKFGDRIGSIDDAKHAASAYLQALRYQHTLTKNAELQKKIDGLTDEKKAKKLEEKLIKVSPEQEAGISSGLEYGVRHPEVKKIADMWMAIKNNVVDFQEKTGHISKETAEMYRKDPAYVPLYRLMDDLENTNPGYRASAKGIAGVKAEKHFEGSERDVKDIFDNMVHRVMWGVESGIKNFANQRIAKDLGIQNEDGEVIYHKTQPVGKSDTTAPIWIDGKQRWVEYTDPSFATALNGIDPIIHSWIKLFGKSSKILRMSVTSLPMFQALQIVYDAQRAAVYSGVDHPFKLMGNILKNAGQLYYDMLKGRENAIIKEMERAGVHGGYAHTVEEISDAMHRKYNLEANTKVKQLLDKIDKIASVSDMAQRKAIYEQTIKETGDKVLAEHRARNIINWNRHGSSESVRVLTQIVPFMNAYIQSMDVLLNTINGTGISTKEKSIARNEFKRIGMQLALLSFVYSMAVGDDDEYQKMNDREKISNLVIPGIGMVPVASEVGFMFKALPEMLYQYFSREGTKNPMDSTKLKKALWNSFANAVLGPNAMPQAIKPIIEATANHSFLTGNELIGPHLKNLETSLQFNENTSELGKLMGRSGLISPIIADHIMKAYGGTVASLTLMSIDSILDAFSDVKRPTQALHKNPIIGKYVIDSRYKDQVDSYYDLLNKSNEVASSLKEYKDTGNLTEAKNYQVENKEMLKTRSQVLSLQTRMTMLREQHKKIVNSPKLSGDEKREKLDQLEERIGKTLKNINLLRVKSGM